MTDPTGAGQLRGRGKAILAAMALAAPLLAACAQSGDFEPVEFEEPESAIDYEVVVEGAPDDRSRALLGQSLSLYRQQEDGAASLAFLRRRANGDVATVETILRSRGYYAGEVRMKIDAPPPPGGEPGADGTPSGDDPGGMDGDGSEGADDGQGAAGPPVATVTVQIEPGPQYTLAEHRLILVDTGGDAPAPLDAAALGSPVGGGAVATGILGAEQAAVDALRRDGRPYAEFRERSAVADPDAATIEVESIIATGPGYRFGPVRIEGAPNIEKDYLLTYVPWEPGQTYSTEALSEYQNDLFSTGLFNGASVAPPEDPPEGDAAPVVVRLEEAPFRTVSLGARFGTDDGPAVRANFEHRNLFGANETFGIEAEAGLEQQIIDFTYLEPQFLRDGQDLTGGLELRHIDDDRFEEIGGTVTAGLRRELSERWTVGAGGLAEVSFISDTQGDREAYLGGIPLFVAYDSTESELDPVQGLRGRLGVTPFAGLFDNDPTAFLKLELRGSAYHDILDDGRYVLAGRGRIGSIVADAFDDVPNPRRFYSGGGGSVRGYQEDIIGPLDDRNDPLGGLSVAEAGVEIRARVVGDIGVVLFTEAGVVGNDTLPDLAAGVQVAAGVGLRYYSPIGPIRVDVGFPLNGRDADDVFQAYFSIGQAF